MTCMTAGHLLSVARPVLWNPRQNTQNLPCIVQRLLVFPKECEPEKPRGRCTGHAESDTRVGPTELVTSERRRAWQLNPQGEEASHLRPVDTRLIFRL